MGEPGRGSVAPTVGAAIVALAVLAAVMAFIGYGGGLTRHVKLTEWLTPAQRAAAESQRPPARPATILADG
jgi:hypothetical protein